MPKAIEAALTQKGVALTVSVYDDHSSDSTRELEKVYPTVHWIFNDESRGYVVARNKFMSETSQPYFCSLDDDSWFTRDEDLATGIAYLDANPDVAAIAYDILSPDRPDRVAVTPPHEVSTFIGCGHIVRVAAAREVGFYEPFPSYYGGEEKDLCLRLIDRGYKIMKLPGVHIWHEKTMIARDIAAQHRSGVCNDLVFAWCRVPWFALPFVLWSKTRSHRRFAARYSAGELVPVCEAGIQDFWTAVRSGRLHRRPVSIRSLRRFQSLPIG